MIQFVKTAGEAYALEVLATTEGVVLSVGAIPLCFKTEAEVLDLIRSLGAACNEKRRMTGGPTFFEQTSPYAVDQAVRNAEQGEHRAAAPKTISESLSIDEKAVRDLEDLVAAKIAAELEADAEFFCRSITTVPPEVSQRLNYHAQRIRKGHWRAVHAAEAKLDSPVVHASETEQLPSNPSDDLNLLRDEALRIAVSKGFTDATVGEDFALMHSEISEALEDHRAGKKPDEVWYEEKMRPETNDEPNVADPYSAVTTTIMYFDSFKSPNGILRKPCGIPSELADMVIRVLHFSGKHGIDIAKAVREKMSYNESRPFRHEKIL